MGKLSLVFIEFRLLFDFILMDLIMPEMGGYDATTLIRKAESEF